MFFSPEAVVFSICMGRPKARLIIIAPGLIMLLACLVACLLDPLGQEPAVRWAQRHSAGKFCHGDGRNLTWLPEASCCLIDLHHHFSSRCATTR